MAAMYIDGLFTSSQQPQPPSLQLLNSNHHGQHRHDQWLQMESST